MATETRAPSRRGKTPPHSLVLSQVERILADENFRDRPTLPELLRFLVESDHAGRFDPPFARDKPKPTGKLIVEEFYLYRLRTFMEDPPRDPALAGKKLIAQLRERLGYYYGARPDPKTHGRVLIEIPRDRGTGYRPRVRWTDEARTVSPDDAAEAVPSSPDNIVLAGATHEHSPRGNGLAALLNERLAFLNDPEFGHDMERYFDLAAAHGVYCHNLRTTFELVEVSRERFPTSEQAGALAESCFCLWIGEAIEKICAPDRLRFAIYLHPGFLAHHFTQPDVDFIWYIDLPEDVVFQGRISDIFRIDMIEVDGSTLVSDPNTAQEKINVLRDDSEQFSFEINIAKIAAHRRLRKLRYSFYTLKAKDHRYVAYGTRFFTRGMTIKVNDRSSEIHSWITEANFTGPESPEPPPECPIPEISVSGWLLPRSGVTFTFHPARLLDLFADR